MQYLDQTPLVSLITKTMTMMMILTTPWNVGVGMLPHLCDCKVVSTIHGWLLTSIKISLFGFTMVSREQEPLVVHHHGLRRELRERHLLLLQEVIFQADIQHQANKNIARRHL